MDATTCGARPRRLSRNPADLSGHGASAPTTASCVVADLARDLSDLLDHLATAQVAFCGLSLGGMIGLHMALHQPDLVRALVVANSQSSFVGPEMTAMVEGWIDLLLQQDGPLKRLHATWPALVNDSFRTSPAGRAAFGTWAQVAANVQGLSLSHVARGMNQFDLRGRLSAIQAPTLVIAGELDRLFTPEQGLEISREIPGSRFAMIRGAGHISSLDSPDQFNGLLLDFLATHFPMI